MAHFEAVQWLPVEATKVFAFFSYPANLPRIMPPELHVRSEWAALVPPRAGARAFIEALQIDQTAGAGSEFIFSFRPLPWASVRLKWRARIEEYVPGSYFRDTQLSGPMQRWSHRHEFQSENRNGVAGTLIRDRVEFEIGFGWVGKLVERFFVLPSMQKSFEHRQGLVKQALR